MTTQLLNDLAKAKVTFQLRAVQAAMGIELINCGHCDEAHEDGAVFCDICGEHHEPDAVPYGCQSGDGY